jgi:hypothetical protein
MTLRHGSVCAAAVVAFPEPIVASGQTIFLAEATIAPPGSMKYGNRLHTVPHHLGLVTQVYDCLFNDWFDAPARGRNGWFKTEATNDLLEHSVALRVCR